MVRPDRFELPTYWFVEIQVRIHQRSQLFRINHLR
jgi:hypothetical protein